MPGLLKRTREEMEASSKGTLQNPEATDGETPRKRQMLEQTNGNAHHLISGVPTSNGTYANGIEHDNSAQARNPMQAVQHVANEMPPEIHHVTEGYLPLSLLVERVSQDTFNGLNEVLDELAQSSQSQLNGASGSAAQNANTRRRTKLWEFAATQRAKLIKLLVLSQWSRNAEAVSKFIDINHHLFMQKGLYREATAWVGELTRILNSQPIAPPDLKRSLGVLARGKADWISALNYNPPELLSSEKMLEVMREINTNLNLRFGLHETVPEAMKNYKIHDGRVTFAVEDEFELDLSLGSDDPSEQLYFVDFRFIFSPGGGSLPEGPMMQQIEARINSILGTKGLGDCYDMLHELCLTHKLTIFRTQALQLAKSRWGENIKIEPVHRALVIQYWINRPGKKSWVEIGIKRHRTKQEILDGMLDTPHLSLRWHRHNDEVFDHGLQIDIVNISLETVLKDTIAAHTNYNLGNIRKGMRASDKTQTKSLFKVRHRASPVEPAECRLDITFPDSKQVILTQEPVSGRFAILPTSQLHNHIERDLNNLQNPAADGAGLIKFLRAMAAMERYQVPLAMIGWQHVNLPKMKSRTIERFFRKNVQRFHLYRPPSWDEEWCLGICHYSSGEDIWWLIRLHSENIAKLSDKSSFLLADFSPIRTANAIQYDVFGTIDEPSFDEFPTRPPRARKPAYIDLCHIAAKAVGQSVRIADGHALGTKSRPDLSMTVHFDMEKPDPSTAIQQHQISSIIPVSVPILRLQLSEPLLTAHYDARVGHIIAGVYTHDASVLSRAVLKLKEPLPVPPKPIYFDNGSLFFEKHDNTQFTLCFKTPNGKSSMPQLFTHLRAFARLVRAMLILSKSGFEIDSFTADRLDANLLAHVQSVSSGPDETHPATLTRDQFHVSVHCNKAGAERLSFAQNGPFARITVGYNEYITRLGPDEGLAQAARLLVRTAPLMTALHELERMPSRSCSDGPSGNSDAVRPWIARHGPNLVTLLWGTSASSLGLQVGLDWYHGELVWRVQFKKVVGGKKDGNLIEEGARKVEIAWKEELCRRTGNGWMGVGTGMIWELEHAGRGLKEVLGCWREELEGWFEELKVKGTEVKAKSEIGKGKIEKKEEEEQQQQKDASPANLGGKQEKQQNKEGQKVIELD